MGSTLQQPLGMELQVFTHTAQTALTAQTVLPMHGFPQILGFPILGFHMACAGIAMVLGAWLLARRKGTAFHRGLGRLWVVLMVCTSVASFFIQARGQLSALHLLSVISLLAVAAALVSAWRRNLALHRKSMMGAYAGLVIAGLFALLPDRTLGQWLFGSP